MNKFLVALPILALLSLGAVYYVSQNDLMDSTNTTIDSWQQCFQKLPVIKCDQLTIQSQLDSCNRANYDTANLMWPGAAGELPACTSFYAYFQKSQAGDELNYNNYYNRCFDNSQVISAASQDNYFYTQIYAPKYIHCAGL